jgi:hypothetical protein
VCPHNDNLSSCFVLVLVLVWQLKKKEDLILQNGRYLPKIADYDLFRSIGKGSFAEVFVGKKQ